MIEVHEVAKKFGPVTAVDGVSFNVPKDDIFGLVGPDGAGKTTLIRMICGLIVPDRGKVFLDGLQPGKSDLAKQNLGYMPQRFSLYGDLTVMENIKFFGWLYGLSSKTIRQRAGEILATTGLMDFTDRLADNLSGGMKQKLALTNALVTRPAVLVLDEPTYGVDPEYRKEFWKILYLLNKQGMTILVSTPYMDEAALCKKVAFMDAGRVMVVDSPDRLKEGLAGKVLEVRAGTRDPEILDGLPGVLAVSYFGDKYHVTSGDPATACDAITRRLEETGIPLASVREITPTMEDVYVSLAGKEASW